MTETTTLDPKIRNRILRYVHTGNEEPKYFPGCWGSHKYFEADKLKAVDEALSNGSNNVEVVNIILKAFKEGWYTRFDTIAFALTKCLLVGSPAVKEATYKAALEVCRSPEEMMTFNKYTRILKTGNGQGWCKHVRAWYANKDPLTLAREISRVKARHGRSHKILLRKCHLKIPENDLRRNAVVRYAIFGLKRTKQMMGVSEETKDIFDYIQKVEEMRCCEDPAAAAQIAQQNNFTLDHVPGHLLTCQDVWDVILPQFSLRDLLYNIQRIHNMGFLNDESTTTAILVSLLNDNDVIQKSNVTPLEVYITINNYKKKCRPMKHEKAKMAAEKETRRRARQIFDPKTGKWEWTVTRRHPKEVKNWGIDQPPNQTVLSVLTKLIDYTWVLTPSTGARYLITMDMRPHMFRGRHFCKSNMPKKGKKLATSKPSSSGAGGDAGGDGEKKSKKRLLAECFYNKHVTPGHAAIILALQILKREKNVQLAVFTEEGIQIVSIDRKLGIDETEFILKNENLGRVQMDAPIVYATKSNQKVDVFINMVDRVTRYMELDKNARGGRGPGARFGPPPLPARKIPDHCPVRALMNYRSTSGLNKSKLIVMSLASHRVGTTDGTHEGVLDIIGIDEHVPKLIDAFTLGQFE